MTVTDVRNVPGQADDGLSLLADIPQNLRDRVPQCHDLLRLGRLQELLQRHRLLLRPVVKDEIFDDEGLDDGLETACCILRASKTERVLGRVMTVSDASPRPFTGKSS